MKTDKRQKTKDLFFFKQFFLSIFSAIFSAILLSLCFSPLNLGFLAWFAFVPFLFALEGRPLKERLLSAFIFGFLFFLSTISWLKHVSGLGLIILCLYLSLYFCLFGALTKKTTGFYRLIFIPLLWVGLELLRSSFFTGFGWALLGYSQFKNLWLIQIADKVGIWGISFLVVLVNVAITQLIRQRRKRIWKNSSVLVPLTFILLSYGYGFLCFQQSFAMPNISVTIIQGNIPQEEKWDSSCVESILARFYRLTLQSVQNKPDLVIWPETSVPGYLLDEANLLETINHLAQDINTYLLVGSPREDHSQGTYHNSAFLFAPSGELEAFHDKIHLVPFGEYLPLPKLFWFLGAAGISDFSPGDQHTIFLIPDRNGNIVRFAVLVCFEDIFPQLVREFRNEGADFLITITNEAWFKESAEPIQHLAMSVFRAIENRCWFIRCANTGISCFIDPHGRVRGKVEKAGRDIFISGFKTMSLAD